MKDDVHFESCLLVLVASTHLNGRPVPSAPRDPRQMSKLGEWEYWRDAYRLWDRYVSMPPTCRTAVVSLTLAGWQVPDGGLLALAQQHGGEEPATSAIEDMTNLTSMSSLDFDDLPLPAGMGENNSSSSSSGTAGGDGGGGAAAGAAAATEAEKKEQKGGSGAGGSETTELQVFVPPAELQQLLLVLLELIPRHVGDAGGGGAADLAAALGGGGNGGTADSASRQAAASAAPSGEWLPAASTALQIRYSPVSSAVGSRVAAAAADQRQQLGGGMAGAGATADFGVGGGTANAGAAVLPEALEASCYEIRWAQGCATLTTAPAPAAAGSGSGGKGKGAGGSTAPAPVARSVIAPRAVGRGGGGKAAGGGTAAGTAPPVVWCAPIRLTQAQLLSLINIFTEVVRQVPHLYNIQPPPLVVPTLSPLERLLSAARGAANSAAGLVGLLALLAVPLAAAIKAGHLNAAADGIGSAARGLRFPLQSPPAAVAAQPHGGAARPASMPLPASARAQPTAESSTTTAAASKGPAAAAAEATPSAPSGAAAAAAAEPTSSSTTGEGLRTTVELCRLLEEQLRSRMWMDVTGTDAAILTPDLTPPAPSGIAAVLSKVLPPPKAPEPTAVLPCPRPQFQLVVATSATAATAAAAPPAVSVLGCSPVNPAGTTTYSELPLAAAAELRGRGAAEALGKHLAGLTAERIAAGKATPGKGWGRGWGRHVAMLPTLLAIASHLFALPSAPL